MKRTTALLFVIAALLLSSCTVVDTVSKPESAIEVSAPDVSVRDSSETEQMVKDSVEIKLSGDTAEFSGEGVSLVSGDVFISGKGSYLISGTYNGRIIVCAADKDVKLLLNGCSVTSSGTSALHVYRAGSCEIIALEESENSFTDSESYKTTDDYYNKTSELPDACVYSDCDTIISGAGRITVNGLCRSGISCKGALTLSQATLDIKSVKTGIKAATVALSGAKIGIDAGNNGISATTLISAEDAAVNVVAVGDGLQCDRDILLKGGGFTVNTDGGHGSASALINSAKGIKADGALTVNEGTYKLDCRDDAFHSAGNCTITNAGCEIATGDDAFHSDALMTLSGGNHVISSSAEGLEGESVVIDGGSFVCHASKNGIDTSGDGSDTVNAGKHTISINGYVVIISDGDGINTAGSFTLSGGTLAVSCANVTGSKPIDSGSFKWESGTFLTEGADGYKSKADDSTNYQCIVNFGKTVPAGSFVKLEYGSKSVVIYINSDCGTLSYGGVSKGDTVTVTVGGSCDAFSEGLIITDADYKGGSVFGSAEVTTYYTEING